MNDHSVGELDDAENAPLTRLTLTPDAPFPLSCSARSRTTLYLTGL